MFYNYFSSYLESSLKVILAEAFNVAVLSNISSSVGHILVT